MGGQEIISVWNGPASHASTSPVSRSDCPPFIPHRPWGQEPYLRTLTTFSSPNLLDVYHEEGLILGGCKSVLSLTLVWLEVVWKDKPNLILTQIKSEWLTSEG